MNPSLVFLVTVVASSSADIVGIFKLDVLTQGHGSRWVPNNAAAGSGPLVEGVWPWADLKGKVTDVPEWMTHMTLTTTSSVITTDFGVFFQCPAQPGSKYCEFYAFTYPCKDCPDFKHGNFVKQAYNNGWEPFRCAPSVQFSTGPAHKMIGFKVATVPTGSSAPFTIKFDEDIQFAMFANDWKATPCHTLGDQSACEDAALKNKCEWKNNMCELRSCMGHAPTGPSVCTTHCITLDVEYRR